MFPSTVVRTERTHTGVRFPAVALEWGGMVGIIVFLWVIWRLSALPIVITVDGMTEQIRTLWIWSCNPPTISL
jgi:hypothetical protein